MSRYRIPSTNSKFYIPKEDYLTAVHWCLRYPQWCAELDLDPDTSRAIGYDQDRVQATNDFDPVSTLAIRRAGIAAKKKLLEETIKEADEGLYQYLLMGIGYGFTEHQLKRNGMPCSHNYYYKKRQQVLYEIAKKI